MRDFYFEVRISNEEVTRDEAEAFVRDHFDQPEGVVIERYEEEFEWSRLSCVRIQGRALRRPS